MPRWLQSLMLLKDGERKALLLAARRSIEEIFDQSRGNVGDLRKPGSSLAEPRGVFVTLYHGKKLRGCIGVIETDRALIESVGRLAKESALHDSRFTPLAFGELSSLRIEISVLSELEPVQGMGDIQVGLDGLFVKKGSMSGLLLPQVATEAGWSEDEFLRQVLVKAGLDPEDCSSDIKLFKFQAEVFGEA